MEWTTLYPANIQPTESQISEFIATPLWASLNDFICESYEVGPKYSYSACSGQPGWNVKYQKAGRSLCTLYPMDGFFIALVVIGAKERMEAELLAPSFTEHVRTLLKSSGSLAGAQWLMIQVTDDEILADVKRLIQLRRKTKK